MELTIADVARFPRPGTAIPGKLAFTPDGRGVTFLKSARGDLVRELFKLDLTTGEVSLLLGVDAVAGGSTDGNVSREEALRRERERLRETGITHYEWAEAADVLLVPVRGDLLVRRDGALATLARGAVEAHLSRDGELCAFVRDGDLWCVSTRGGEPRRLTSDAGNGVTNGLAEFVAQEEMARSRGFWISPDATRIAFQRVDERGVALLEIPHLAKGLGEGEEHRYPFVGAENVKFQLGVVAASGGAVTWLDTLGWEYLARVMWARDGRLLVQLETRDQRRLELRAYDVATGAHRTLLVEESASWVNLHQDLRSLESGELLWASERTGWKHLYLYRDDVLVRPLTSGDWAVDAVHGVDGRHVFFSGGRDSPLERHLYRVPLAGGEPERLTTEPGLHDVAIAPDGSAFVDVHERRARAPSVVVRPIGGEPRPLHASAAVELDPPDVFSFRSRDGTELFGALWLPPRREGRLPLVVSCYGGPHVQYVQESWGLTVDLRAQLLARRGFAVLRVDNRGSARRGLAFESAVHRRLGTLEVHDQVDGVRHAIERGVADPERVGIYGWSYGGYLTLRALELAPEVFRCGVSGAPVTEWEGYDTHYTERYMDLLGANADGYRASSAVALAEKIRGRLLLVHGMIDENVHFRHSARLLDALVKAGIPHELILFPDERHMPRGEKDRAALEARIVGFFEEHLGNAEHGTVLR